MGPPFDSPVAYEGQLAGGTGVGGVRRAGVGASAPPRCARGAAGLAEVGRGATSGGARAAGERSRASLRVAIGHGETEGAVHGGRGYRGARADEPVRVTVVYFVTPVGEVTRKDMEAFAAAFARWDSQAIWGGSFVTKETL